jgi:hypothetical protein
MVYRVSRWLVRWARSGDSQRAWWTVRREMNRCRHVLGPLAARLSDTAFRPELAGVLADPGWLPAEPVDLADVELAWRTNPSPPTFTGGESQASGVLPYASDGRRYDRYSRAVRDLARPTLFDNRVCYRPLSLGWQDGSGAFRFGYTSYFEALDVCEALGHEYTAAWLANDRTPPTLDQLPFRAAIGDPFDPTLRPMPLSVNTLTVRRGANGHASFLLHKRSSAAVAVAGGMYHVVPAGVFQPSSIAPWHQANDFDLWRNIMREMFEELLGAREYDGNSGQPIDYATAEPFRLMAQARGEGRIRAYCLGAVVEPLTWWVEAQTVVVFDADVFDAVFRRIVPVNDEGYLLTAARDQVAEGIPFTAASLTRLRGEPIAPVAASLLHLAWRHREPLVER